MKTLATHFKFDGFQHEQVVRRGMFAVYRRTKGSTEHYETIRIQSHNGYKIAGRDIPASETYPSSSSWGTLGWTYPDEETARAKMSRLEAEQANASGV
jgi:hypothetical protein